MSHDPGLRFWLSYAETEGALVEDAGDQALAVLPQSLQEEAELPEDAVVTSDPDVARDDGAILLISGHPALERAAEAVLGAGDVGHSYLSWPTSERPRMSVLQARARERFQVEHGRIDAAGEPRRAYLPLLRAGAMITYPASLALRFQEQEEAWIDATTGVVVPDRVLQALEGQPRLPQPDAPHRPLTIDMALALAGAHAQLEERAAARRGSLVLQARRALESELMRADAYYHGALESIERRRASAAPERRLLLDGQAEATRAEHARRRREIEEELQARHEIRPFRLQLLHAPALVLPVEIRRGARTFPFEFVWLATAGAFTDVRCPHCGAAAELTAGRDRLGCRSCLRRPTAGGSPSGSAPEPPAAEQSPRPRSDAPDPPRSSAVRAAGPVQPQSSTAPTAASDSNGGKRRLDE